MRTPKWVVIIVPLSITGLAGVPLVDRAEVQGPLTEDQARTYLQAIMETKAYRMGAVRAWMRVLESKDYAEDTVGRLVPELAASMARHPAGKARPPKKYRDA